MTMLDQLLVVLAQASVHSQQLLVLVMNSTLEAPCLLAQGTVVSTHVFNLHLQFLDFPCIGAETTILCCSSAVGVLMELEHVLGISYHALPPSTVVLLVDIICPFDTRLPLRIGVALN
jgi:hypothetical protein